MMQGYRASVAHRRLVFRQPAGTSRGVYQSRDVYYIYICRASQPEVVGVGECAPLPGLSREYTEGYGALLQSVVDGINQTGALPEWESLFDCPSIRFGLEVALRHLERGDWALWDTPFARGEQGIVINGLVWMGSSEEMLERIEQKIEQGCRCIKMKIGAIDFDEELRLLRHIRQRYSAREIELRVDANGAFPASKALEYLHQLAPLDLHSIEQPIGTGQWSDLRELVELSPIAIALDEELIGVNRREEKVRLLDAICPHYIILKPSLHGGWAGSDEWIALAQERGIAWWATSALESNIGLNAIAQWCACYDNPLPQGLGTGQLFVENVALPLYIKADELWYGAE